ncbi:hypothetical protein NHH03_13460 [Stieleria sp. TO1_6]|uniref:hypothetical protein n=1 Tax=Stieleria tagensis TaxID=2956795 RepID=UPI00209B0EFC|nr:hypothetical protein [Stieleria tagensis]MCO8122749.1 hypothetical protein [Stieleria tagensis]
MKWILLCLACHPTLAYVIWLRHSRAVSVLRRSSILYFEELTMSFELVGNPTLKLKYSNPNLKKHRVGVQTAEWDGRARVKVKNDHGKKWRIGFVQLLEKNMMMAVYKKTKRSEILLPGKSMPVLDADDNHAYRPFYDDNTVSLEMQPKDVQTSIGTPEKTASIRMWDEPESQYKWWLNDDETNPLEEFVMNLEFSTYIVARDITAGSGIHDPFSLVILKQWSVVLDRRYEFTVVKDAASLPGIPRADLTKTKCVVKNPMRQPFVVDSTRGFPQNANTIFQGAVANDVFTDDDTLINKKSVGEFVKARAAMWGGT